MDASDQVLTDEQTLAEVHSYFTAAKKPVFVGALTTLFFYLLSRVSFLTWPESLLKNIGWLIAVIAIITVAVRVNRLGKDNSWYQAASAAVLVGLGLGLVSAILQLIWFWSWWQLPNLIVQPLTTALVGLAIGVGISLISKKIKNYKPSAPIGEPITSPKVAEEQKQNYADEKNDF